MRDQQVRKWPLSPFFSTLPSCSHQHTLTPSGNRPVIASGDEMCYSNSGSLARRWHTHRMCLDCCRLRMSTRMVPAVWLIKSRADPCRGHIDVARLEVQNRRKAAPGWPWAAFWFLETPSESFQEAKATCVSLTSKPLHNVLLPCFDRFVRAKGTGRSR